MSEILANSKSHKANLLLFVLVVFFSAYAVGGNILPYIPRIVEYVMLVCIIALIAVQSHFFAAFGRWTKICRLAFCFIILVALYFILGVSSASVGNVYNQVAFFTFAFIALFVEKNFSNKQKNMLLYILMVPICLSIAKSIMQYNIYGVAIADLPDELLVEMGVVNTTPFNTMSLIIFSVLYLVLLNEQRFWVRVSLLAIEVLFCDYLFFCGSRGSIVIAMLFIIVMLPMVKMSERSSTARYVFYFFLLIFVFLFVIGVNAVLDFLISISPDRLAVRFADIKQTANFGLSDSSFSGRYGLYRVSIDTFFSNVGTFLFGIGDHRGSMDDAIAYAEAGIGGHSEFLDSFARWGVCGGALLILFFINVRHWLMAQFDNHMLVKQSLWIYIVLLYCFVFKSVFMPNIGCAAFLVTYLLFDKLNANLKYR